MLGKVIEKYVFVLCFEKSFEEVKIENCFRWVHIWKELSVGYMEKCLVYFLDFVFYKTIKNKNKNKR